VVPLPNACLWFVNATALPRNGGGHRCRVTRAGLSDNGPQSEAVQQKEHREGGHYHSSRQEVSLLLNDLEDRHRASRRSNLPTGGPPIEGSREDVVLNSVQVHVHKSGAMGREPRAICALAPY